jgi:hypothetical protein
VSQAKRAKIERCWGAKLTDTFGMTEAGMMGAEDRPGQGLRIWTDMYYIEVLDPMTLEPAKEGEVGTLVVTALWSNNVTPFLRWSSGDLVIYSEADDGEGPFSVFPRIKHAHRTAGFFKIRGVNLGHQDLEDFMFRFLENRRLPRRSAARRRQRLPAALHRNPPRRESGSPGENPGGASKGNLRARAAGAGARGRHARAGIRSQHQGGEVRGPPRLSPSGVRRDSRTLRAGTAAIPRHAARSRTRALESMRFTARISFFSGYGRRMA